MRLRVEIIGLLVLTGLLGLYKGYLSSSDSASWLAPLTSGRRHLFFAPTPDEAYSGSDSYPTASPSAISIPTPLASPTTLEDMASSTHRRCQNKGRTCSGLYQCCDGLRCVRNKRGNKTCRRINDGASSGGSSSSNNNSDSKGKCKQKGSRCGGATFFVRTANCCDGLKCGNVQDGVRRCK